MAVEPFIQDTATVWDRMVWLHSYEASNRSHSGGLTMESGQLRKRIVIQTNTPAQDAAGQPIASWADTTTRWGSIEPLSGRELMQIQAVMASATHRVRMRYYSGLTVKHRLKFGTRYLEINSLRNLDERGIEHECICTELLT